MIEVRSIDEPKELRLVSKMMGCSRTGTQVLENRIEYRGVNSMLVGSPIAGDMR
jgi:hypothetical protein